MPQKYLSEHFLIFWGRKSTTTFLISKYFFNFFQTFFSTFNTVVLNGVAKVTLIFNSASFFKKKIQIIFFAPCICKKPLFQKRMQK